MSEPDPLEDRELTDRLGRASGAFPDDNAAYTDVLVGVRRARRRRALVVSSAATAALVIALVVGVTLRAGRTPSRLVTAPPNTLTAPPVTVAPTVEPTVRTFSGDGGAIEVSSNGTTLHVVSTRPNDRYTADVRDGSGQRIEVRFSSRWHRTTIRVELRNGAMTPVVTESDSGSSVTSPVTAPPTSTGGSHGEGGDGGGWGASGGGERGPGG